MKNRRSKRKKEEKKNLWEKMLRWEWLIVLVALICDFNSWGHQFALDDRSRIVTNAVIQSPGHFLKIFTSPYFRVSAISGDLYRPLTSLSYAITYWISGPNPDSYHVFNRLLQVLTSLAIFWSLRRLFSTGSFVPLLTALIFAAHPLQTEAITYIDGRGDSLSTLCFILGWLFYLLFRQSDLHEKRNYSLSLLFYFLALLSKEGGITWAGIILLTEFVFFSQKNARELITHFRQKLWGPYLGYIGATVTYLGLRFIALKQLTVLYIPFIDNPLAYVPIEGRLLTSMKILFQSLAQILFPLHLCSDYSFNQIPIIFFWTGFQALTILALTAGLVCALVWSYRRSLHVFFGLSFFLITYSIVSNIFVPIGTIRADRLLYTPMIGIILIWGLGLAKIGESFKRFSFQVLFRSAVIVMLSLLAVRTILRNAEWKNEATLTLADVSRSPNSAKIHFELGTIYTSQKDLTRALEQYRIAESIGANFPELADHIGGALLQQGKTDEAITYFRRAVALSRDPVVMRNNLAVGLSTHGDRAAAQEQYDLINQYFDNLIQKYPDNANLHYDKGNALYFQGKLNEALSEFQKAVDLDPDFLMAKKSVEGLQRMLNARRP